MQDFLLESAQYGLLILCIILKSVMREHSISIFGEVVYLYFSSNVNPLFSRYCSLDLTLLLH